MTVKPLTPGQRGRIAELDEGISSVKEKQEEARAAHDAAVAAEEAAKFANQVTREQFCDRKKDLGKLPRERKLVFGEL